MLLLGFALGVLHAFDADHMLTVTALSARGGGQNATVRYAVLWALGHSGLLLLVAGAVSLLRWSLPPALTHGAELMVGVMLICVGAAAVARFFKGDPQRAENFRTLRERIPFAIGMIHGAAGSAAVLALIPMTFYQPLASLAYVAVFSCGVLVAMLGVGFVFERMQRLIDRVSSVVARAMRLSVGLSAFVMGAYWLRTV